MQESQSLLQKLEKVLRWKRSKSFYAERLNVSELEIKELLRELRNKETELESANYIGELEDVIVKINNERGTLESKRESSFEPKNDLELAALHKIDLSKYKISNYWTKQKPNGTFTSSVFATLLKIEDDVIQQKDLILKELKQKFPIRKLVKHERGDKTYAYEINIPDAHFGKMAWAEESGEDYDLKIAETRYTDAIDNLLSLVDTSKIEKIIFPVGNDMINIDSRRNETTAGTRQDSDSRFFKMVMVVKNVLIKTINSLSTIAPVDVIVVSGNHDFESMLMVGEMIDCYYHNDNNVTVDNSPKQRKYYQYGKNGFQYTHGNEEPHKDLGLIFATEQPKLWADTEYRFAKLGHFHKNKKTSYVSIDEYQGFRVQILPSLSGSDAWHSSKGYMSKKQAKGFLYHKSNGEIAEYTYNI